MRIESGYFHVFPQDSCSFRPRFPLPLSFCSVLRTSGVCLLTVRRAKVKKFFTVYLLITTSHPLRGRGLKLELASP
jgi:hypothetical protein